MRIFLSSQNHASIEIIGEIPKTNSIALPHIRKHCVAAKLLCGAAANEASTYFDGA